MPLARPAFGDLVATQRTHGHALYVKLTPSISVRARIAPVVASFIRRSRHICEQREQHIRAKRDTFSSNLRAAASETFLEKKSILESVKIDEP